MDQCLNITQLRMLLQTSHNPTPLPDAEHLTCLSSNSAWGVCSTVTTCLVEADECAEYEGILLYTYTTPGVRVFEAQIQWLCEMFIIWTTFLVHERYLLAAARTIVS